MPCGSWPATRRKSEQAPSSAVLRPPGSPRPAGRALSPSGIARASDVPVGNVYYYFKTKDDLVEAAIGAHAQSLQTTLAARDELPTPQDRLKTLIGGWVGQRDRAARFGCPFGTLSSELDK